MSLALGLMSGTSLDGVDAALVDVHDEHSVDLLAFVTESYEPDVRALIRNAIDEGRPARLAELDVTLAESFAETALRVCAEAAVDRSRLEVVGSHGQTIWHDPGRASLQLGNAAVLAERTGVPVVSDFRSADIAAGGQGAPLVPMADAMLFAGSEPRVLLNIGGMANVTWVREPGALEDMVAFDTGPGVAIVDGVTQLVDSQARFDRDGERAQRGVVDRGVVAWALAHPYFDARPPKSTGRETFGAAYAETLLERVRATPTNTDDDVVATATAVVAASIGEQVMRWLPASEDVLVSGGGARNPALLDALRGVLKDRAVRLFGDVYFDGDAKEAVAFAYLAWRTKRGLHGNVPSATGAVGPRVLGSVTGVSTE